MTFNIKKMNEIKSNQIITFALKDEVLVSVLLFVCSLVSPEFVSELLESVTTSSFKFSISSFKSVVVLLLCVLSSSSPSSST